VVLGGRRIDVKKPVGQPPVFVRENSLLPLAKPVEFICPDTCFDLEVRVYGKSPRPFALYEDDGETNEWAAGKQTIVTLAWDGREGRLTRAGGYSGPARYRIGKWTPVGDYDLAPPLSLANGGFADNARDFAVDHATGYVSQCKPIAGWTVSDPQRVGVQPLVNGLRNMGPAKVDPGAHFAFIQFAGNWIRQTVDGLTPGKQYVLSYRFAARDYADATSPKGQQITATVRTEAGDVLGATTSAARRSGFANGSVQFVATEPAAVVEFRNSGAPGETTVCVTGVELKVKAP
jgi:hypothetical protein